MGEQRIVMPDGSTVIKGVDGKISGHTPAPRSPHVTPEAPLSRNETSRVPLDPAAVRAATQPRDDITPEQSRAATHAAATRDLDALHENATAPTAHSSIASREDAAEIIGDAHSALEAMAAARDADDVPGYLRAREDLALCGMNDLAADPDRDLPNVRRFVQETQPASMGHMVPHFKFNNYDRLLSERLGAAEAERSIHQKATKSAEQVATDLDISTRYVAFDAYWKNEPYSGGRMVVHRAAGLESLTADSVDDLWTSDLSSDGTSGAFRSLGPDNEGIGPNRPVDAFERMLTREAEGNFDVDGLPAPWIEAGLVYDRQEKKFVLDARTGTRPDENFDPVGEHYRPLWGHAHSNRC